jgi:predicted N-acyltransferase
MPDSTSVTLRIETDITAISAAEWDRCAGADNPFVSHAFLAALEESGSARGKTGWLPQHLVMEDAERGMVGIVPAYVKSHSYGEYVFDHGWAQAIERAGGRYYPKLQVSVPFTPATGPRLLVAPGVADDEVRRTLVAGLEAAAGNRDLSSVHATFLEAADRVAFERAGWLIRHGCQYHWQNDGYATFDDFLGALSSRKRKDIRKERQRIAESDIEMVTLTGGDPEARALGRVLPLLHRHVGSQMGLALSDQGFLSPHRPHHGRPHRADHGAAARELGGGRAQSAGVRRALRPQLGL